jgi:hypothetical protein
MCFDRIIIENKDGRAVICLVQRTVNSILREKCVQKTISALKRKDMVMLINHIFRMDLQSHNRPYFTLRSLEQGPQDHHTWS